MKKLSKKKKKQIIEWCTSVFFLLCTFVSGFHFSSILFILSAVLMAPLKPVRQFLSKHKLKNGLVIALSLILFFAAAFASPVEKDLNVKDESETSVSQTVQNEKESSSLKESQKEKETKLKSDSTAKSDTQAGSGLSSHSTKPSTSKLPKYKGQPYAVINGGNPSFNEAELTRKAYEKYSPLDKLGRCQKAIASLGIETMPKAGEKRESISSIRPTGWRQAKYEGISSKDLYNRCHLIGWQLSAENANPKNLITGTRYMNVDGMLPFENMVADYIKETKNHVAYRVTPIYIGNNLVASGVQIEAYSIEDNGDGICFNVYCFNVQPGIKINYANGESSGPNGGMLSSNKGSSSSSKTEPATKKPNTPPLSQDSKTVYITGGECYHYDKDCAGKNGKAVTLNEAIQKGKRPCKKCAQ